MDRARHNLSPRSAGRRRFVEGVAAGTTLALFGPRPLRWARAATAPSVLSGTDFSLEIGELEVNYTGTPRIATVVNGQLPGPVLRWREGDLITLRVSNRLRAPTSIHWHGIIVPADMDGVPGISFDGIGPGETYVYRFRVNQSGTYWYHGHSRFQEQTGLYGPIIVEPRRGERHRVDRDYIVLLSDWTDIDPEHVYRLLKLKSDYFNFGKRTVGDLLKDIRLEGLGRALDERRLWGQMRMDPTDLADVSGYAYTYLMNGATPAANWTGLFQRGDRLRLRFINGSSMSIMDVRIPGLKLTVVAADGQDVEPVSVDEFRLGAAEVLDVIVEPKEDRAYTIFAQSIDRTGYARGTLAPSPGMQAQVPALDPRPLLGMADMGMGSEMGMQGMDHGGMSMDHEMDHEIGFPVRHVPTEYGPGVDSLARQPQSRLDDPGVGLRDNGRRALCYADLHTLGGPIDRREALRDIELHLTGHMRRFMWSFNGEKFSQAEPLRFHYGERLRIVLVNDSMMHHPIHLHGMWGELQSEQGEFLVRKHTITVQPGQRLAYGVTADALGRWAYHCHLIYHMQAGMFREVAVERASSEAMKP
ncbi:MAG TPA: copper resistance system multicopper oxidase [Steroidobacteraceae bacterium]|nr:copper resistance system multicopper oxidase [Steroidobacteraceae bacterium]